MYPFAKRGGAIFESEEVGMDLPCCNAAKGEECGELGTEIGAQCAIALRNSELVTVYLVCKYLQQI